MVEIVSVGGGKLRYVCDSKKMQIALNGWADSGKIPKAPGVFGNGMSGSDDFEYTSAGRSLLLRSLRSRL